MTGTINYQRGDTLLLAGIGAPTRPVTFERDVTPEVCNLLSGAWAMVVSDSHGRELVPFNRLAPMRLAAIPVHELVECVRDGSAADQCQRVYELLARYGVNAEVPPRHSGTATVDMRSRMPYKT